MNIKSLYLIHSKNNLRRRHSLHPRAQSTLEYVAVAAMITGTLAFYPTLINALGVYLKSMQVILAMAMP